VVERAKQIDVLLIEDSLDDTELTLYSMMNVNDRLHYRHFTNGEDALDFVFNNKTTWGVPVKDHLKLIILDLTLPKVGGLAVAKKFKESEQTKTIPIVVLSSSKDTNDINVAYEIGVNSYVVKPDKFDGYLLKIGSLASYWSTINERPN